MVIGISTSPSRTGRDSSPGAWSSGSTETSASIIRVRDADRPPLGVSGQAAQLAVSEKSAGGLD